MSWANLKIAQEERISLRGVIRTISVSDDTNIMMPHHGNRTTWAIACSPSPCSEVTPLSFSRFSVEAESLTDVSFLAKIDCPKWLERSVNCVVMRKTVPRMMETGRIALDCKRARSFLFEDMEEVVFHYCLRINWQPSSLKPTRGSMHFKKHWNLLLDV